MFQTCNAAGDQSKQEIALVILVPRSSKHPVERDIVGIQKQYDVTFMTAIGCWWKYIVPINIMSHYITVSIGEE
jgi:hypothetical protein